MNHKRIFGAVAVLVGGLLSGEEAVRFDHKVRQDFFAGIAGDKVALARGMKTTEEVLIKNPDDAEALVWHGSGLYSQAGEIFRNGGDQAKGMELFMKGQQEMDRAAALAPKSIGVRIPRGATYLTSTRFMGNAPFVKPLVEKGLSDYQAVYEIQKENLDKLGVHPLGELLFGLADGNSRMGNEAKAKEFFEQLRQRLPESAYAKRAATWLETKSLSPAQSGCIGCHVSKQQ